MVEKSITPGEILERFSLKDQDNADWDSSSSRGKRILLSFHPLAWTPICAEQMIGLEKNMHLFEELSTVPLGVSVDSVPCKSAWARELGLARLRVLSDFWPHGKMARELGLFREKEGFSERANVLVNEQGIVVFERVYPIGQVPDLEEILDFIRHLHHSEVNSDIRAEHCMGDLSGKSLCVGDSRNTGIQSTSDRHLD